MGWEDSWTGQGWGLQKWEQEIGRWTPEKRICETVVG